MNTSQQTIKQPSTTVVDEAILVVKRDLLFTNGSWHGLHTNDFESYFELINKHREFQPRSLMEQDPTYKQIIPYLIFKYRQWYFLMQRHKHASEQRLQSKYTLGIGGHIRQEDLGGNSLFSWAEREFHEEIRYHGDLTIKPLGILNDDSNEVGKVHLGLVLLLDGSSGDIHIRSELSSGVLMSIRECSKYIEKMETWSQIVLAYLNTLPVPEKKPTSHCCSC